MSKSKNIDRLSGLASPAPIELVFLDIVGSTAIPFTTSEVIAVGAKMNHRRVRDAIHKHRAELESFGVLGAYKTETPKNQEGGRKATGYLLNEQQATFLLTLLKNTPVVVEFKKELVRQFYAMRSELIQRRELRPVGKLIHRRLTDALRESGENTRMHGHAYTVYTNLAYKLTTGKSAKRLRKERGAGRRMAVADLLTAAELERYQRQESAITALLDVGFDYTQIRAALICRGEE